MNTATYSATLPTVIRAGEPFTVRNVKPLRPASGSVLERVVEQAARKVRDIYVAGRRFVSNDPDQPEFFQDLCFETWMVSGELERSVEDDTELAIAAAIFERAGWHDTLRPTTLRAQVEMQIVAVETARRARRRVLADGSGRSGTGASGRCRTAGTPLPAF